MNNINSTCDFNCECKSQKRLELLLNLEGDNININLRNMIIKYLNNSKHINNLHCCDCHNINSFQGCCCNCHS